MLPFGPLDLWRLAGKRSFDRGERYLDAVGDLLDIPGGVIATVQGTEPYEVRLTWTAGELAGECNCPWGQEGEFCKHCVAVGLALIARGDDRFDDGRRDEPGDMDDLRGYLAALDHAALVDLLCECAAQDPDLHRTLRQRATAATSGRRGDRAAPSPR